MRPGQPVINFVGVELWVIVSIPQHALSRISDHKFQRQLDAVSVVREAGKHKIGVVRPLLSQYAADVEECAGQLVVVVPADQHEVSLTVPSMVEEGASAFVSHRLSATARLDRRGCRASADTTL